MIATVPFKRKDGGSSFATLFNYMRYEVKDDEALEERGDAMLFNLLDEQIIVQEMQIVAQMNHRCWRRPNIDPAIGVVPTEN
jgi:hypothetical protein